MTDQQRPDEDERIEEEVVHERRRASGPLAGERVAHDGREVRTAEESDLETAEGVDRRRDRERDPRSAASRPDEDGDRGDETGQEDDARHGVRSPLATLGVRSPLATLLRKDGKGSSAQSIFRRLVKT